MAQDGRVYDGTTTTIAMDAETHPSILPPTYVSSCVNRSFRQGVNSTRPPFTDLEIKVAFGYDPSILNDFQTGNFQGAWPYKAVKDGSVDGIVCSVAGVIYFLSIVNNVCTLYKLIDGNDPTMMHTWFVQAQDWIYVQNGYQDPIAWNGDITGTPTNLQAQGLITNNINLTWTNNALGYIGTEIQVQYNGSIFNDVTTVNESISEYTYTATGLNIQSATRYRTSNVAYITTKTAHGLVTGQSAIIQNMSNSGYNVKGITVTVTSDTAFNYGNAGANEGSSGSPIVDTQGNIGKQSASTEYSFRVRSLFPDGSATPWSNIATTSVTNPTITTAQPNACFRLNPVKQQMPIGTIMAYAYGRVAVSDANNNIYISDIIYGNGFTTTSNTQNFTEQTYWAEGGSFTPPANLGLITGMRVMPSLNINVRGQGELVVFCENGSFTLDLSQNRSTWQQVNIQKVSLIGRGCRSPWSITGVNNDVYFRSDDGWAFYNNAQVDFYQALSFKKVSREVQPWVNYDTPWLRQFESAIYFDNRIIATVSPFTVAPANPATSGLHRPSRAMIVLDVEQESKIDPQAAMPSRWNGLWEGPQPTQLLTAQINGVQRAFAFSFDGDNVNRIYELQNSSSLVTGVDDYSQVYGSVPIKSYFVTKRFDFVPNAGASKFVRKQLVGGEVWVSNLKEAVQVGCEFRPDSYPCFVTLSEPITIGLNECTPIVNGCKPAVSQPRYQQLRFPTPDIDQCETFNQIPIQEGAEFQIKVKITGTCIVDRLRLAIIFNDKIDLPQGYCPDTFYNDPTPVECSCQPDLDYYRIVPLSNSVSSVAN
jgi:hypothetical protein